MADKNRNRFMKGVSSLTDTPTDQTEISNNSTINQLSNGFVDGATQYPFRDYNNDSPDESINNSSNKHNSESENNSLAKSILQNAVKPKEPKGENRTIYLSPKVIEKLNEYAATTNQTKSKIVNNILEQVFFGD